MNRLRDDLTEQFLRDKLAENGIKPLGAIHDTPAISMAWLMGEPLIETPAQTEADRIVEGLEITEKAYLPEGKIHEPI